MGFDLEDLFDTKNNKSSNNNKGAYKNNYEYSGIVEKLMQFKKIILAVFIFFILIVGIIIYFAFSFFQPMISKGVDTFN